MLFLIALGATLALASPLTPLETRQTSLCSSGTALCCELNALGVIDVTCQDPTGSPANQTEFMSVCAASGLTAECCTLPVGELALLCETPN